MTDNAMVSFRPPFLIVQPYGPDPPRQATVVRVCPTAEAAFQELDALSERMRSTGVRTDAVQLIVVDSNREQVPRPDSH